ncbi:RNA polymerase sigma-70 factor, ECF subfamily [Pseudonocardia thermophila]|uniref:RNA polymerase sigma-70 factor, ECF subfamily n=1 Tax=Pseudonocardia thermophila TaxID=1848 RepID=A0A1M6PJA6_PSETH|nr:RNA polymerase sigma factor [Pseudonocardia thermophila]SHK08017.1 RNA polymerase sigma-70 factor, ECF subfamily [Pseudonocardia thermophila]
MSGGENVRPVRAELALLDLYDEALPQVYGYLLARCGRVSLAEELTAETLLAAVTACRRVPPPVPSTAWLVGIARHKLVDHWRAAEREHRGLAAVAQEPGADDDPWENRIDALVARDVLAQLDSLHRAALTLRYLDGLGVGEVARLLRRTVPATESLLARSRAAFRREYRRIGGLA